MKKVIRSTLVSKHSFFLCLALLACGSIGGTFTNPVPDKHPDSERTDTHPPSANMLVSAPAVAVQAAAVAKQRKASAVGGALPTFRYASSGGGDDAESRSTRSAVSLPLAGGSFANVDSGQFNTLQASSSPDQGGYASGNDAPVSGFGGAVADAYGGAQGARPASGLVAGTPGGGCLAAGGAVTAVPLGGGYCFVSSSESSGSQVGTIALADGGTQPPTVRQSISVRPGQGGGGGNPTGGSTPIVAGPSMPGTPPHSSPGSSPSVTAPPIVADITPFTSSPIVEINAAGGPSFTPAGEPPGPTSVPEPATLGLVFLGFASLVAIRSGKIIKHRIG